MTAVPTDLDQVKRTTEDVNPATVHDQYPRPQMVRETWRNLNGSWDYAIRPRENERPQEWDGEILVPFCVESALSGAMQQVSPEQAVWYRRTFSVPEDWSGNRVLLHFGAADWEATVQLNGLMTYDREVIKMDPERIAQANRKLYEPPPVIETLVPTSQKQPQTWQYTTRQPAEGWQEPSFEASSWKQACGGFGTEGTPGAVVRTTWDSSDVWLRRTFELNEVPDEVQLLIHHDEDAEVYLNGAAAAELRGYTTGYTPVPIASKARAALQAGANVIAIYCHQSCGGQYCDRVHR